MHLCSLPSSIRAEVLGAPETFIRRPAHQRNMDKFEDLEASLTESLMPDTDSSHTFDKTKQGTRSKAPVLKTILVSTLVFCALLAIAIFDTENATEAKAYKLAAQQDRTKNCGASRAEAIARKCAFDVMSFSWLPQGCYDADLTQQFLAMRNWTWTTEEDGKLVVPFDEVIQGLHSELYVTWEYHIFHCAFAWRKFHRALESGVAVDSYLANVNHTHHCSETLMKGTQFDLQERNTIIRTKFVQC